MRNRQSIFADLLTLVVRLRYSLGNECLFSFAVASSRQIALVLQLLINSFAHFGSFHTAKENKGWKLQALIRDCTPSHPLVPWRKALPTRANKGGACSPFPLT